MITRGLFFVDQRSSGQVSHKFVHIRRTCVNARVAFVSIQLTCYLATTRFELILCFFNFFLLFILSLDHLLRGP